MTADGSPETFDELLDFIERHAPTILVREVIDNVPGNYRLADLPAAKALHHAFRWIRQGIIPARVIPAGELNDDEGLRPLILRDTDPA